MLILDAVRMNTAFEMYLIIVGSQYTQHTLANRIFAISSYADVLLCRRLCISRVYKLLILH